MGREIKFRAWDEMSGSMCKVTSMNLWSDYESQHSFEIYDDGEVLEREFEDIELMQYTGLTDKNGTEIYEGDILSSTSELLTNFGRIKTGKFETTIKEVFWKEDSWATRVLESKTLVIGSERKGITIAAKYGEVIGNVYENPELLKNA